MRACFEALRGRIGTKDYSEVPLPGRHVGLFVSSESQDVLSKDISGWLAARD